MAQKVIEKQLKRIKTHKIKAADNATNYSLVMQDIIASASPKKPKTKAQTLIGRANLRDRDPTV